MDAVERRFATLGIREYRLMLVAANDDARRFYASRGMTLVSDLKPSQKVISENACSLKSLSTDGTTSDPQAR